MAKRHGRPSDSTATSTTTPGCSGDGRAAEHGAFNGEGCDLNSYPVRGRIAQRMRNVRRNCAGVHLPCVRSCTRQPCGITGAGGCPAWTSCGDPAPARRGHCSAYRALRQDELGNARI